MRGLIVHRGGASAVCAAVTSGTARATVKTGISSRIAAYPMIQPTEIYAVRRK